MLSLSQFLSTVVLFGVIGLLKTFKGCYNNNNAHGRLILDATINDSLVELFDKLGWLPIDDIVCVRKLCMLHKVSQGHCPEHFSSYFKYVRSTHGYRTRSACKRNSGLRTFHSSACRLWNNLGNSYRNIISHSNFRKMVQNNFITENTSIEHFKIRQDVLSTT